MRLYVIFLGIIKHYTTDSDATESDVTKDNYNHKYLNLDIPTYS